MFDPLKINSNILLCTWHTCTEHFFSSLGVNNKGLNGVTHSTPSRPSTQASWPQDWQARGTVSPVCYCVRGAKPPDSVGYSEGQAEKRLGSLASCCRSEPRPGLVSETLPDGAIFKTMRAAPLWLKTGDWMLWGRRGWAFIYSHWHVGFMICRSSFLGHQRVPMRFWLSSKKFHIFDLSTGKEWSGSE